MVSWMTSDLESRHGKSAARKCPGTCPRGTYRSLVACSHLYGLSNTPRDRPRVTHAMTFQRHVCYEIICQARRHCDLVPSRTSSILPFKLAYGQSTRRGSWRSGWLSGWLRGASPFSWTNTGSAIFVEPHYFPPEHRCQCRAELFWIHSLVAISFALVDTAPIKSLGQLRSLFEKSGSLLVAHPFPASLVHLGPFLLFLIDGGFEEVIRSFGCMCGQLRRLPVLGYLTKVGMNLNNDTSFLPRLSLRSLLLCILVCFPSAFGEHPALVPSRLDEKDEGVVGGEGHDACYESFALRAIAWEELVQLVQGLWTTTSDARWLSRPTRASIERS